MIEPRNTEDAPLEPRNHAGVVAAPLVVRTRLVLFVTALSFVITAVVVGENFQRWTDPEPHPLGDAVFGVLWYVLIGVGLALWLRSKLRLLGAELVQPSPTLRSSGWALVLSLWLVLVSIGSAYLFLLGLGAIWPVFTSQLIQLASEPIVVREGANAALATGLNLVSVILLAPLVEEVLFRRFLLLRWGAGRGAMVGTSLIFALLHFDPVGAFIFAWVQCLVYLRTGSLALVILIHATNNAIAVVLSVLPGVGTDINTLQEIRETWWIGALALVVGAPLLRAQLRRLDRR